MCASRNIFLSSGPLGGGGVQPAGWKKVLSGNKVLAGPPTLRGGEVRDGGVPPAVGLDQDGT